MTMTDTNISTMSRPLSVLVLCTGNSARSQIAEALLQTRGAERLAVSSAGSHPAARVNRYAVETLRTHGIPWEDRTPQHIDAVADAHHDLVITVCDNARDACPFLPGAATVHWGLPDPAEHTAPDAARRAFEETFRALERRVNALLALPLESFNSATLAEQARRIHESS
jgi:arsenate reductase (thioredoxin)